MGIWLRQSVQEFGGKILLIGVGVEVLTHVHVAEDAMKDSFPVNVWLDSTFEVSVKDAGGQSTVIKTRCHDPVISRRRSITAFEAEWLDEAVARTVMLAGANITLLDSSSVTENLKRKAESGRTIYGT